MNTAVWFHTGVQLLIVNNNVCKYTRPSDATSDKLIFDDTVHTDKSDLWYILRRDPKFSVALLSVILNIDPVESTALRCNLNT